MGDEVVELRIVLDAGKHHLVARDDVAGAGEKFLERVIIPDDVGVLRGRRVGISRDGAGLAAEPTMQRRADAILARLKGMAGLALTIENLFALLGVAGRLGRSHHRQGEANAADQRFVRVHDTSAFTAPRLGRRPIPCPASGTVVAWPFSSRTPRARSLSISLVMPASVSRFALAAKRASIGPVDRWIPALAALRRADMRTQACQSRKAIPTPPCPIVTR